MSILVLGAKGMAGHVISIKLKNLGYDVTGFDLSDFSYCKSIVGNVMSVDLPNLVCDYDAVINCIGVLNAAVDANPDIGIWLNSYLPHLLARHAKRVIHISTDCVFSGHENGKYNENDFRSTNTLYGRSKALGELDDNRNLTLRTSIVGPEINENGIGLFNWFMKQREPVGGYTHAIWGGVTTLTLADAVDAALQQGITGLCHLTNGEGIRKYELLKLFNTIRKEPIDISESDALKEDKSLVSIRSDFNFKVPSYSDMAKELGRWVSERRDFYPQYNVK